MGCFRMGGACITGRSPAGTIMGCFGKGRGVVIMGCRAGFRAGTLVGREVLWDASVEEGVTEVTEVGLVSKAPGAYYGMEAGVRGGGTGGGAWLGLFFSPLRGGAGAGAIFPSAASRNKKPGRPESGEGGMEGEAGAGGRRRDSGGASGRPPGLGCCASPPETAARRA